MDRVSYHAILIFNHDGKEKKLVNVRTSLEDSDAMFIFLKMPPHSRTQCFSLISAADKP